jgi:hypothetical protein
MHGNSREKHSISRMPPIAVFPSVLPFFVYRGDSMPTGAARERL